MALRHGTPEVHGSIIPNVQADDNSRCISGYLREHVRRASLAETRWVQWLSVSYGGCVCHDLLDACCETHAGTELISDSAMRLVLPVRTVPRLDDAVRACLRRLT